MLISILLLVLINTVAVFTEELNWYHLPGSNYSYYIYRDNGTEKFNFAEAQSFCQNLGEGSDIAIVETEEEAVFIYNHTLEVDLSDHEWSWAWHYIVLSKGFSNSKRLSRNDPEKNCTILIGKNKNGNLSNVAYLSIECDKFAHSFVCKKFHDNPPLTTTAAPAIDAKIGTVIGIVVLLVVFVVPSVFYGTYRHRQSIQNNNLRRNSSSTIEFNRRGDDNESQSSGEISISETSNANIEELVQFREPSPDIPIPMFADNWDSTYRDGGPN